MQLVEDRRKGGLAEIFPRIVGMQPDAVGLEHVEGMLDLLEAAVDVGRREHREEAEAGAMVAHDSGGIFVPGAHDLTRGGGIAEPGARRGR